MTTVNVSNKQKILIVDDSELNRAILKDILNDQFLIEEAENGKEALLLLDKSCKDADLILLDIVMPHMDGFAFMRRLRRKRRQNSVPVIMISAENMPSAVVQAFDLGVSDFISRPFDPEIVRRRVLNTIMLYAKQKQLLRMVLEQVYEKEQQSGLMVSMLSHIVEFRNGESGPHILHIQKITDLFLKYLPQITDKYPLSREESALIGLASALHDIGKIAIPGDILNKPGRLTDEEYKTMKTHTVAGAQILKQLDKIHQQAKLTQVSYQICRWHHERWDGKGYPDGLKGDDIPLSAQIVALADVYDALTSQRVYKPAFSHEKAVQMITEGQCGAFNPLLLECLVQMEAVLKKELQHSSVRKTGRRERNLIAAHILNKMNVESQRSEK